MKICFIVGAFPPMKCGVGDYTFNLASELSNSGNEVHVITSRDIGKCHKMNLNIHNIMNEWSFKEGKYIKSIIKNIRPDIVHIQYPSEEYGKSMFINLLPMVIKNNLNVKIVETVHEYLHYTKKGKMRNLINYKFSDSLIVVEERYEEKIKEFIPRISKNLNIEYVPISSNIPCSALKKEEYIKLRETIGLKNEKVIVYFGFINELKGFETLLKTVYCLKRDFNDIKLLVLSELTENNEYHKKIIELINQLELNNNIITTGFIKSPKVVCDYIKISNLAILPFKEGVSERNGSFLAVFRQGIPIITTSNECIEENNGVYYTKPNDVDKIVKYSKIIFNNENEYRRKVLSWNEVAKRHIDVYEGIAKNI